MPNDRWDVPEQVPHVKLPKTKKIVSMGPRDKPPIRDLGSDAQRFDANGMYIPFKKRQERTRYTITMNLPRRKRFGRK